MILVPTPKVKVAIRSEVKIPSVTNCVSAIAHKLLKQNG